VCVCVCVTVDETSRDLFESVGVSHNQGYCFIDWLNLSNENHMHY